jgi:hypothetical protein
MGEPCLPQPAPYICPRHRGYKHEKLRTVKNLETSSQEMEIEVGFGTKHKALRVRFITVLMHREIM